MLSGEPDDRDHDTSNRRSNEQQEPKLNDAASAEPPRVSDDAADRSEVARFTVERLVRGPFEAVPSQEHDTAAGHDDSRDDHTDAQHVPQGDVELFVGPACAKRHFRVCL